MRTTVSGSGRGSGQKSLEASSVPIAMTASASAVSSGSSSRKPMAPRLCSPSSSMTPLAFEDRMIPAPRAAASASISWPAPWAPAPAMMSGRRQAARASAAVSMWSASALGSGRVTDGWDRPGPVASMRSRGISIAAGHLRPARMADSVCPTARDTSPGLVTRWTSVSTAARAPDWLRTSWRRPLPRPGWVSGMPGQMRSTGTESVKDWSRAVSALSTAGPVVVTTTLTSPVRRAAPSAM